LEEICDLRQPVLFDFDNEKILETTNKTYLANNYHAFEIKIRNIKDSNDSELYVPLSLHSSMKLFDEDKNECYFSENNTDFLQETGVKKNLQYNDEFLRPYMVSNCDYDIMMGSENTRTPFRYEINYRNYFIVTEGSCQIKLAPPQSIKYLHPCYDYENFEFRSPINPWQIQPKYAADFDKIKCLEFTLQKGKTIFIPAYWWYSIKLHKGASISCFRYRTYMNNLAISPYIALHALQLQNVKRDVVKKVSIDELNIEIKENKMPDGTKTKPNINENNNTNVSENNNTNVSENNNTNVSENNNTNVSENNKNIHASSENKNNLTIEEDNHIMSNNQIIPNEPNLSFGSTL
jgi:hypothetical protein